jgi:hypothetical protein
MDGTDSYTNMLSVSPYTTFAVPQSYWDFKYLCHTHLCAPFLCCIYCHYGLEDAGFKEHWLVEHHTLFLMFHAHSEQCYPQFQPRAYAQRR